MSNVEFRMSNGSLHTSRYIRYSPFAIQHSFAVLIATAGMMSARTVNGRTRMLSSDRDDAVREYVSVYNTQNGTMVV